MMRLLDIMGLPSVDFYEPTFDVLPDETYTHQLLGNEAEEALLVVDERDWPLALALRTERGWRGTNFILHEPMIEAVERFEEVGGEIRTTTQEEWMRGTRDYYSLALMKCTTPAMEDHSQGRSALVKNMLLEIWGDRDGGCCLDCGCGSGMGAAALREVGFSALAYDNDPSLLSLGLHRGRLLPEETMLIDATLAGHYLRPAEHGLALMAGTINDFTSFVWKNILTELMELTKDAVVTVESEKEAGLVRLWALGAGKKVRICENTRDRFYDRWVCHIEE